MHFWSLGESTINPKVLYVLESTPHHDHIFYIPELYRCLPLWMCGDCIRPNRLNKPCAGIGEQGFKFSFAAYVCVERHSGGRRTMDVFFCSRGFSERIRRR